MKPKAQRRWSARADSARATEAVRFGIVLPIHNEEELASAALASLDRAIAAVPDPTVTIGVAIVLDTCSDGSAHLVDQWRQCRISGGGDHHVHVVNTKAHNVGHARKRGCDVLLSAWGTHAPNTIWLATTDADSQVPEDWITTQLGIHRSGGQVWVGPVRVSDWSGRSAGTAAAWRRQYRAEYLPIHGANFGMSAATYLDAGGFAELATGEDRDLFERAVALGAVVRHDPRVHVGTSGRRGAHAPGGFAHTLSAIESLVASSSEAGRPELAAS